MFKEPAISLVNEKNLNKNSSHYQHIIGLSLQIYEKKLNINLGISKDKTTLVELVPAARQISDKISSSVIQYLQEQGHNIPCKAGCNKCCKYLVPATVPESLRLNDELEIMDKWQREQINIKCLVNSKKILENKTLQGKNIQQIAESYDHLEMSCPFLKYGKCSIYNCRPLVCREHLVVGSEQSCLEKNPRLKVIQMPLRMSDVLAMLTSELEGREIEAVILPLYTAWYENNHQRKFNTWPSFMVAERLASLMVQANRSCIEESSSIFSSNR